MSTNRGGVTSDGETDLIVKWFTEFSEMQKSDFFKILLKKYGGTKLDSDLIASLLKDVQVTDQRPTIFKCRVKLFDEWFSNWSDEQKETLLSRLATADEDFMIAFRHVLDGDDLNEEHLRQPIINLPGITGKATTTNGSQNGSDSISSLDSLITKKSEETEEQITTEI